MLDWAGKHLAEDHQPWRCGAGAVTNREGHDGIAVYDPGDYAIAVRVAGYESGGGTLHIAAPGVVTRDWEVVPAA